MTRKDQAAQPARLPDELRAMMAEANVPMPSDGIEVLRYLATERFAVGGRSLTLFQASASADDADLQAAGVIWRPDAILLAMAQPRVRSLPEVTAKLLALSGLRTVQRLRAELGRVAGVTDGGSCWFAGAKQHRALRIPHRTLWSLPPNGGPNDPQTVAK